MYKCQNCGKSVPFVYQVDMQGVQINLCVDCQLKVQQIAQGNFNMLAQMMNFLGEEMDSISGLPYGSPRFRSLSPPVQIAPINYGNVSINADQVGVVNTGSIQTLDFAVEVMKNQKDSEVAKNLQSVIQAIVDNQEIEAKQRNEMIDLLAFLSDQLIISPKKRNKSALYTILSRFAEMIKTIPPLIVLWDKVKPTFEALIH